MPFIEYNRKFELNRAGKNAGRTGGRKTGVEGVKGRKEKRQRSECRHKTMKRTKIKRLGDRCWKVRGKKG